VNKLERNCVACQQQRFTAGGEALGRIKKYLVLRAETANTASGQAPALIHEMWAQEQKK